MTLSKSLRNRLIGVALLLLGLGGTLFSPDLSEGVNMLLAFLAGAFLGAGAGMLMTGEVLWKPRTGWAWQRSNKQS